MRAHDWGPCSGGNRGGAFSLHWHLWHNPLDMDLPVIISVTQQAGWLLLAEIVVGALATSGALLFILRWVKEVISERKHHRRLERHRKTIEVLGDLWDEMNDLQAKTQASRILIFSNANGGGYPSLDAVRKSSVLYEVYDTKEQSIKHTWQKQDLDAAYTKVLQKMLKEETRELWIKTRELEDGILKNAYQASGVVEARVAYIFSTATNFIYMSIVWTHTVHRDATLLNDLRSSTNRIRNLYQYELDS